MPKFLIEVPHEEGVTACTRAVEVFVQTGSHFLSNADWGCLDGDHKAWIVVDLANKQEARMVVPPAFRHQAKVVQLNKFTMEDIEKIRAAHQGQA
jgi:hypothetical protein